jgi:tRNA pseudouridine55 synthase
MSFKKATDFEEGQILLFDKPLYWTSFDLVNKVKKMICGTLGIKKLKVGHAGTLDPLASGLMIICTGKATRNIDQFRDLDKEYLAAINIGETTPSFDLETAVDKVFKTDHITKHSVIKVLSGFLGEQMQEPPLFSAKFVNGKRAYELARKGIERTLDPVKVFFREVELVEYNLPKVKVRVLCSKGTYLRSFARDLGEALDSGGYLSDLKRTAIGPFKVEEAIDLGKFKLILEQLQQS